MQQALEALEVATTPLAKDRRAVLRSQAALRSRLAQPNEFTPDWDAMAVMVEEQQRMAKRIAELEAQPEQEFIEHHGDDEGWSEWVCPDPKGYLMKCCDCGLVHEAEFGVVRYKSETEREDCDRVDDPNLQAVFRMRRSEQWSPEDTAHRAGGMPMAQPEQEPVAWADEIIDDLHAQYNTDGIKEIDSGDALIRLDEAIAAVEEAEKRHTAPPQRKPLPPQSPCEMTQAEGKMFKLGWLECEAAHGIKGKA
jgi:hypothetical protein